VAAWAVCADTAKTNHVNTITNVQYFIIFMLYFFNYFI